MEILISRYRNVSILAAVLFVQDLGLAVKDKRSTDKQSTRLIRVWTVGAIAPLEKGLTWFQGGIGDVCRSYVYLRGVRQENRDLKYEIERLRLQQQAMNQGADGMIHDPRDVEIFDQRGCSGCAGDIPDQFVSDR